MLSVARYNADGTVDWLPLVHGQGPLTAANGFASQADVVIETRRAADLLGATKMDRPEDVEANPVTQKVYVILTNNGNRKPEQVDAANPRADNRFGHIIEMIPPGGDHAAAQFRWEMLVRCGDPSVADGRRDVLDRHHQQRLVRHAGQLSRSTARAGCGSRPTAIRRAAPAAPTACGASRPKAPGAAPRGISIRVPVGAELCGPCFTPDDETLFVAVQHPGGRGVRRRAFDLRGALDALARLQARHAAAAVGGRHHQTRRRQDRDVAVAARRGVRRRV